MDRPDGSCSRRIPSRCCEGRDAREKREHRSPGSAASRRSTPCKADIRGGWVVLPRWLRFRLGRKADVPPILTARIGPIEETPRLGGGAKLAHGGHFSPSFPNSTECTRSYVGMHSNLPLFSGTGHAFELQQYSWQLPLT